MDDDVVLHYDRPRLIFAIGSGALDGKPAERAVAAAIVLEGIRSGPMAAVVPPDVDVGEIVTLCRMLVRVGAIDQDGIAATAVEDLFVARPEMN